VVVEVEVLARRKTICTNGMAMGKSGEKQAACWPVLMPNAFAICVNKRRAGSKLQWQKELEERKKFLLSVQSVREIENCRLSSSHRPCRPASGGGSALNFHSHAS